MSCAKNLPLPEGLISFANITCLAASPLGHEKGGKGNVKDKLEKNNATFRHHRLSTAAALKTNMSSMYYVSR